MVRRVSKKALAESLGRVKTGSVVKGKGKTGPNQKSLSIRELDGAIDSLEKKLTEVKSSKLLKEKDKALKIDSLNNEIATLRVILKQKFEAKMKRK